MAVPVLARQRVRARYSGRVQGVGFRYAVVELARPLALDGYVCNLPDGDVEVVAEGMPGELDRLLAAIAASRLERYIIGTDIQRCTAVGGYTGFCIRY